MSPIFTNRFDALNAKNPDLRSIDQENPNQTRYRGYAAHAARVRSGAKTPVAPIQFFHPLALVCSEALECRGMLPGEPLIEGNEIMFMPAGVNEITPSQSGKPIRVQVLADPSAAIAIEKQRVALEAKGDTPYFDLNHDDVEASFWPKSFYWKDGPAPGIYARGEWSDVGLAAKQGKTFRSFSPVFHVDDTKRKPARIICYEQAKPNMGGLVNNPAFKKILPLWAKHAGASSDQPKTPNTMTSEEIAALQAKNTELQRELDTFKSQQQSLKAKDESDAVVASKIEAHEMRIKLNNTTIEAESLKAKNATLEAAEVTRREADADAAITAAVGRGAIAARDEPTKAHWKKLLITDPANIALLAKQGSNPAFSPTPVAGARSNVAVTGQDGRDLLKAYDALRCKQLEVVDVAGKTAIAREMGAIWASDMRANDRFLNAPLVAADVSNADLGTLAGTLVAQRTLEYYKLLYGNILKAITTDFSDVPATFNQTTTTRVVLTPAVMVYNPANGTDGRPIGWVVGVPAETLDVPIKLNNHIGAEIVFDSNTLGSTVRNLFGEQGEAQAFAIGNYMITQLYALLTAANFGYSTALSVAAASFGRNNFADAGAILNPLGVPPFNRAALLNSPYYAALQKDSNLVNFAAFQRPEIVEQAELMPISKFQPLEAPNLPTTGNLAGAFLHKTALVIQTRIPNDYTTVLPGASYGNVAVVNDPDTNLSTLVTQYVSHQGGYAAQRQALMFGVGPGITKGGLLLLSSGSLTGTGAGGLSFAGTGFTGGTGESQI